MDTTVQLFTRKDIARLANIPDDVLNYWMREGVLRAAEGGDGRGQHRRFDYPEVTLAAILDHLRGFGLSVPTLKRLAERFHSARDYMRALGYNRQTREPLDALCRIKQSYEKNGFASVYVGDAEYDGLTRYDTAPPYSDRKAFYVDVTLEQAMQNPKMWFPRYWEGDEAAVIASANRIIWSLDIDEFDAHRSYYSEITYVTSQELDVPDPERDNEPRITSTPSFFYRDSAGDWHLSMDAGDAGRAALAFIGINVEVINWRLWHGNSGLRHA